jgi:hypothetical protein
MYSCIYTYQVNISVRSNVYTHHKELSKGGSVYHTLQVEFLYVQ